jgi:hypothetical protein
LTSFSLFPFPADRDFVTAIVSFCPDLAQEESVTIAMENELGFARPERCRGIRDSTHPVKEDVKKKFSPLPSEGGEACIQPLPASPSLLRGVLVLPLWIAA